MVEYKPDDHVLWRGEVSVVTLVTKTGQVSVHGLDSGIDSIVATAVLAAHQDPAPLKSARRSLINPGRG